MHRGHADPLYELAYLANLYALTGATITSSQAGGGLRTHNR